MYALLPFQFYRLNDKEILVNEVGDYLIAPTGTVERMVQREILSEEELYKDLVANFFISPNPVPPLMEVYATRLRTKKSFLDHFTALHIFVLTLRCNQNCCYCQASSRKSDEQKYDMPIEVLDKSIALMFRSPSPHLTMEFQGGEPTLVPHLIRHAIVQAEEINKREKRQITYVICTNCVAFPNDLLDFCKSYNVVISTSLDGTEQLHNRNRGVCDSYQRVVAGISKVRAALGEDKVSALMTTSELSLNYPREIVDSYRKNGFHSIFIRALNPYGLAASNRDWESYTDRFITFYKTVFEYILELNLAGEFFVEEYAAMLFQKILTPFPVGFVDLQSPSGIINGVAVYNYDGYLYASDESRMLAEQGDYTFRLGSVNEDYTSLFYGRKAQQLARLWGTEYIAGCSDCAFQGYCGADPVRNYSMQGDCYGHRPTSLFCRKNKQLIEYLFSLLMERKEELLPVFKRWIR